MLAPRPSRIIVRAAVVIATAVGIAVGAASAATAVTVDNATVHTTNEAPATFEWD
ncbi:MAG: hypothetical protein FWJ70_12580 [Micromonosporaceae bacterium]|jgi:ABC-type dipeptide/oligopeptide/nickel transport system permease subunit